MSVTSRYRLAWEGFWREAPEETGAVFWDAEPALTAALHLPLFHPHLTDPGLPLVDLGCGNGTQTRFLADRFPRVLGVDLSASAVDRARRSDPAGQAAYRVLDATDKREAETLHAELGDANVYRRVPARREQDRAALTVVRGRVYLLKDQDVAMTLPREGSRNPRESNGVLKSDS